jgi:hypothetical protein
MAKAALLAAFAALALSGYATWRSSGATCRAPDGPAPAHDDALAARLDALERRVGSIEDAPRPVSGPAASPTLGAASPGTGPAAPAASAEESRSAAARLDDLEKRLAGVEDARKKDAESPAGALGALAARAARFGKGGWVATTEDAQKELELTDGQKAEWDRIVADARREGEALRRIPDDEGKTWEQAQRDMVADLMTSSGGGGTRLDLTKVLAYRNKTIPGRSETYGQADQRIKDDAKRRMRDTLTTAQAEKFDRTSVDPLLGGMPGAIATTIAFPGK